MEHNNRKSGMDSRFEQEELAKFEEKLRFALQHRTAPVGLKARVLATARERRRQQQHGWQWMVQRIAASVILAAIAVGAVVYHKLEERRKGEQARDQVLLALKITNKTLNRVNARLSDDDQ